MAKLQIPIEDELMTAAKMFALKNNTTLKDVVIKALRSYMEAGISELPKEPVPILTKRPKPIIKPKKEVIPVVQVIDDDEDDDNTPAFAESIDSVPEWQKRELTPQDFYGKVPEPYTPGPYDHDPMKYILEMEEEE